MFLFPVPRNQLLSVTAACKVLIEFSLLRLENPDEACAVSQVSRIYSALSLALNNLTGCAKSNNKMNNMLWLNNKLYILKDLITPLLLRCLWIRDTLTLKSGYWIALSWYPCSWLSSAFLLSETPDPFNKRPVYWLQPTGQNRDHHLHCDDEICQTASDSPDALRR